jgi:hypothetical protein
MREKNKEFIAGIPNKSNSLSLKNKQKLFLEVYPKRLCNISASCRAIGIARITYYSWRKNNPAFDRLCKETEDSLLDLAEEMLFKNILKGKEASLLFYLKNRLPERYRDDYTLHQTFIQNNQINLNYIKTSFSNLSIEELVKKTQDLMAKLKYLENKRQDSEVSEWNDDL